MRLRVSPIINFGYRKDSATLTKSALPGLSAPALQPSILDFLDTGSEPTEVEEPWELLLESRPYEEGCGAEAQSQQLGLTNWVSTLQRSGRGQPGKDFIQFIGLYFRGQRELSV